MLFFVVMIFSSEDKMDENRAEYSASIAEYEEAMKAYEADSANLKAQYQRIQAEIDSAMACSDSMRVAAFTAGFTRVACTSETTYVSSDSSM